MRKDQRARAIAARDGITEGLVCVFGTIEPCRSFRMHPSTLRSRMQKLGIRRSAAELS